jgi:hypothetical protein
MVWSRFAPTLCLLKALAIQQHARRPGYAALLSQRDNLFNHVSGVNSPDLFYCELIRGVHEHARFRFLLFPIFPDVPRFLRGHIEIRHMT